MVRQGRQQGRAQHLAHEIVAQCELTGLDGACKMRQARDVHTDHVRIARTDDSPGWINERQRLEPGNLSGGISEKTVAAFAPRGHEAMRTRDRKSTRLN